jgi:hypothetical protein
MPATVRFHVAQHHMNYYVHSVVARYCELTRPDQFVFYPELYNTDVTDRVMQLTKALVREQCQVVGRGNFLVGEHFAYIRVNALYWTNPLHCCVYCNFSTIQLQAFKKHVADDHFLVSTIATGTVEQTRSWEHQFYL